MCADTWHRDIRGIGFVEFADPRDAEDAQRGLDLMFLEGREVRFSSLSDFMQLECVRESEDAQWRPDPVFSSCKDVRCDSPRDETTFQPR